MPAAAGSNPTLAVPVAMLAGQLRGQAWAARRLGECWLRVPEHPLMPAAVQDVVARALGDSSLRIARWDAESASYVDVDGEPLILQAAMGSVPSHRSCEAAGPSRR